MSDRDGADTVDDKASGRGDGDGTESADRVRVGSVDDVAPGEPLLCTVAGHPIAVLEFEGELYAVRNECLHQGGPVGRGRVKGALVGDWPGSGERVDEAFDESVPAIACPWHGWEYDLRTGEHLGDRSVSLPTYDVLVEDGELYVER